MNPSPSPPVFKAHVILTLTSPTATLSLLILQPPPLHRLKPQAANFSVTGKGEEPRTDVVLVGKSGRARIVGAVDVVRKIGRQASFSPFLFHCCVVVAAPAAVPLLPTHWTSVRHRVGG